MEDRKENKVLYRFCRTGVYNGHKKENYLGELHYGKLPLSSVHHEYTVTSIRFDYDQLVADIEAGIITLGSVYVDTPLFSKKKCLYECDWWERFKLPKKQFKNFVYDERYIEVQPSVDELIRLLPVNELLDWLKDNKITLKDLGRYIGMGLNTKILFDEDFINGR